MNQDFSQRLAARQFSEVEQLLNYIEQTAIDSESTPIAPDEVEIVTNLIIQRLVLQHPCLDQTIQEILDDLRFSAY
ncbi:hypothetical protein [Leptolyngbya sp. NIES-2104]|uniref:hypothetical protein n=1 Tax=Leptolyngbya sp. NIES-2104 TaxID=1552121 RepID=UPI0006EC9858|nr:hypothetical protein [Leptolyngbya sp. NIES-2104]GAP99756.1 hypothetical protein NIES2104_63220 [Leptolyngbya sp. NIES-2104]